MCKDLWNIQVCTKRVHTVRRAGTESSGSAAGVDVGISEAEKPLHLQDWMPDHYSFPYSPPLLIFNQFVLLWGRQWWWQWKCNYSGRHSKNTHANGLATHWSSGRDISEVWFIPKEPDSVLTHWGCHSQDPVDEQSYWGYSLWKLES